jgi:uncharacterized protein with PIN domain
MLNRAEFRFYEELNDFLPARKRKKSIAYYFGGNPSVKDAIEALGVPHVEVDLLLVNSISREFSYLLQDGDKVSVYPVFESFDISQESRLEKPPLRQTWFVLDVHLGRLARYLRMLGFDCLYRNDFTDDQLVEISLLDHRIILTRDKVLLKNKKLTHGYWLRSQYSRIQVSEVLRRFDLYNQINPFTRCMECNGLVETIRKEEVMDQLLPGTRKQFDEFYRCTVCSKIYWEGAHYARMMRIIDEISAEHGNYNPSGNNS